MTRILLVAGLVSLVATAAIAITLARSDGASAQVPPPIPPAPPAVPDAPQQLVLKVGDTLRVDGAPLGCQVTRRGGRPVIECRRDGALAGTYAAVMSARSVTVARFRSSRTAQTILTARHGGGWRACSRTARRSRIASLSRGCR
ncbi:MAG: hypothetical protein H0U86_06410 [Chloroflexi bacterium]|nr:hypothetical protein [Chloroflexota bacterium]